MAEIRFLTGTLDPSELSRAYEALQRSFEAGHDLGDRSHHIRMIGTWLETAHQDLRRQIEVFRNLPPHPGVDLKELSQHLEEWLQALVNVSATIDRMKSA